MSDRPQLTVAIPTCNGARHLADALGGVLAQEGVSFELLICDDRSDDDTRALAEKLAGDRAHIEINSERLGLAWNWNRCVLLARTPFVAVFHQDDVMHAGHLAAHSAALDANADAGLVASAAESIDEAGRRISPNLIEAGGLGSHDRTFAPGSLLTELAVGNPLRCSAVTVRADAFAEVGGFDPSFRYALDWDFWIRCARRRAVIWLARPTVGVRWHAASETHRFRTGTADLEEQVRLLNALHEREAAAWPAARPLRRAADRRLARAFLNRAHELLKGGNEALARECLKRAFALAPQTLGRLAGDPRLALQMTTLAVAPGVARRFFSRVPAT